MGTKHHSSDPVSDPKKRRRVGFSQIDAGIEANDCIKIYLGSLNLGLVTGVASSNLVQLVSSKEEVDAPASFCIQPVDLNHFFEEDGKIYGYQGLKITIWVSSISFHAYAEITFQSTSDGGKGITDLKSALQNIFAENIVEKKEDFLQTFSTECDYVKSIVSKGEILQQNTTNGHNSDCNSYLKTDCSDLEVIRVVVGTMPVGHLYSRLVPLVLVLVDGSNPIDITDPRWEILLIVQKKIDLQGGNQLRLLGFAAIYRFYHYPDSLRLRLSQILVLPPYQHKGYGRHLLEVLNNVAICENVYDLTIEEPLDSLQHVRTCIDVGRLLQIDNFMTVISDCVRAEVIRKDSGAAEKRVIEFPTDYDQEMSFVMFRCKNGEASRIDMDENQTNQEQQLKELVDERMKEIKSIAQKVCPRSS
ncbi:hypothetical protein TEA_020415 [Camellia sinensis var. sinensis]|uniref:histone acetyltransferase n=1 Tax=Camellia sinensis var. sinensis TaxID=542762 RepID=A0A4V3WIQ3_CAMSN|nr:hypothetical protein TEA_020415 [Camellia sinensis var. sinensis]